MERIIDYIYKNFLKNILFSFEAEKVHNFFIKFGRLSSSSDILKKIFRIIFNYKNKILEQRILGIDFANPVGLSAGFDKNAEIIGILGSIGFGFAEAGSITAKPCSGNSGIRIKRFPDKNSLLINLGLNNQGVVKISSRLRNKKFDIPYGISIAKTNSKDNIISKEGIKDYIFSLKKCEKNNIGDYYTINISCPNAYGGQPFHKPELYELLLKEISILEIKKPIFVKISPDISSKKIDKIISLSYKYKISGFICSNLTKKHSLGKGGLSGEYLKKSADSLLKYIYKKTKGDFILIGVGGIFSAEDAYKKIKLGANLVQLITGMIYQGPQLISNINLGIVKLLRAEGYSNITEAIGKENED